MPQVMAVCTEGTLDLEMVYPTDSSHPIAKCFSSMTVSVDASCTLSLAPNGQNSFVQALWSADNAAYSQVIACPTGASMTFDDDAAATAASALASLLATSIYPEGMTVSSVSAGSGGINVTSTYLGSEETLKFRSSGQSGSSVGFFGTVGAPSCTDASECTDTATGCSAGSYSVPIYGQSTYICGLCAAGSYSAAGVASCTKCAAGSASATVGATSITTCGACNAGAFATAGSSDCRPCAPGTFASGSSASSCLSCPTNWYSHTYGATACVKCTNGRPALCSSTTGCSAAVGSSGSSTATVAAGWTAANGLATYSYPALLGTCSPADTLLSFNVDETCAIEIRALAKTITTSNGLMCSDPNNAASAVTAYYTGLKTIMNLLSDTKGNVLKIYNDDSAVTMYDIAATSYPATLAGVKVTGVLTVNGGDLAGAEGGTTCPAGTYKSGTDTTDITCTPCEPGTYCETGVTAGVACAAGTSSTMGQSSCTILDSDCGIGKQMDPVANACECAPGYGGASCTICGVNQFSPGGGVACANCTGGLVSAAGSESCGYCPAGEGKVNGVCTRCAAGEEPGDLGASCQACPNGFYNPSGTGGAQFDKCQRCDGGSFTDGLTCAKCQPGFYSTWTDSATRVPADAGSCAECPDGGYSAAGAKRCTPCAGGSEKTYPTGDSCTKCAAGKYRAPYSSLGCQTCSAGTASKAGADTCTTCNPGEYAAAGADTCSSCAVNTYSSDPGSTTCTACPSGTSTLGETGAAECSGCAAGTKYDSGTQKCVDCDPGYYQDREGQKTCKKCPIGKFSDEAGSTTCDSCPAGKYQSVTGSTSCRVCPGGTFSSAGKGSCSICAKGKYSAPGSTACKSCAAGYYANKLGSRTCTACPAGSKCPGVGNDGPDLCPAGSFQSKPAQTTCTPCPKKTNAVKAGATKCTSCPGATTVGTTNCPTRRRMLLTRLDTESF